MGATDVILLSALSSPSDWQRRWERVYHNGLFKNVTRTHQSVSLAGVYGDVKQNTSTMSHSG